MHVGWVHQIGNTVKHLNVYHVNSLATQFISALYISEILQSIYDGLSSLPRKIPTATITQNSTEDVCSFGHKAGAARQ